MSKDAPQEVAFFRLDIKIDEYGTLWLEKSYVDDKQLYKHIKDDITPELVEIVKYMQEATVTIEHELERITNRYKK